jgi:hypothetical protein
MCSNMYTWEITKVRGEYIEYDVNAFTGRYGKASSCLTKISQKDLSSRVTMVVQLLCTLGLIRPLLCFSDSL